jgi:hypothetical protein
MEEHVAIMKNVKKVFTVLMRKLEGINTTWESWRANGSIIIIKCMGVWTGSTQPREYN